MFEWNFLPEDFEVWTVWVENFIQEFQFNFYLQVRCSLARLFFSWIQRVFEHPALWGPTGDTACALEVKLLGMLRIFQNDGHQNRF